MELKTNNIKIVLWNCRGIQNKKNEISNKILEYDIIILTETKYSRESIYFTDCNTIIKKSKGNSGGIIIIVKNYIEFETINGWNNIGEDFDITGIRITNTKDKINIVGVYRRPQKNTSKRQWQNIMSFEDRKAETIVMGDFNAHNMMWNCQTTDRNGEYLHEIMDQNGYICSNQETQSRIGYIGQRSSNIDLIFSTTNLIDKIDIKQNEDSWGSDHIPIEITIGEKIEYYRKKTNKITTKKTVWKNYPRAVEKIYEERKSKEGEQSERETDLESRYQKFTETIKQAIMVISGNKKKKEILQNREKGDRSQEQGTTRQHPKKWWDHECEEAIDQRKKAFKKFKESKTLHNLTEFKKKSAMATKVINRKKRENFNEFCQSINRFTNLSYVWNTMKVFKNIRQKISWNSWKNKNREEEIIKEIDKLAPPYVASAIKKERQITTEIETMEKEFKIEELIRALKMIKKNSSPGKDGIEYTMLKELPIIMKEELLEIINEVWKTDTYPTEWRKYQVIFIDKPGKEKVRPIALSSCVGKIMERMVNERLVWWAEKFNKLAKDQNGFRRGRSCMENLTIITTNIKTGLLQNKYTLATFLDITSAYDNVNYETLMDKLETLECPINIRRYINKWMYYRETEFIINNKESTHRIVRKGLPQGAVLSPILYALYTSEITKNLNENIKSIQFADDIAIYITSRNRKENREKIEEAVNIIGERVRAIGLELEPKKTVLVEFNKQGICDRAMKIEVKNTTVTNEKDAKFLGVWLDNKLNFHKQVNTIKSKVNKANAIMTYLNKKTRGMEVNTALMLYKSIVRSVTEYGNFIYFPEERTERMKIERTQYLGLRTALGYRNSTPTNVIIAESKVRLLRDRAQLLARNFALKNLVYGEEYITESIEELTRAENYERYRQPNKNKSIIVEAWERIKWTRPKVGERKKFEIFEHDYEVITDKLEIDVHTGMYRQKQNSSDSTLIKRIQEVHKIEDEATLIFTDGSKRKGAKSTGASVVIDNQETAYNISMPNQCSIFTAEAFAIKAALELMQQEADIRNRDIVILTDSLSVCQALENNVISVYHNRYILEIRKLYHRLKKEKDKRIIILWIPAHKGIQGNEIADKLAKEATEEEENQVIEVPISDYKKTFKAETWIMTQNTIVQESRIKGKEYFRNYYDGKKKKPWFQKIDRERYFVTMINRIRANHFNLNESLVRKGYVDSARCECGCENESLEHVIWTCNLYEEERIKLDWDLRSRGHTREIDIRNIIKKEKWNIFTYFYKFIKRIGKII
ncbi:hypothetical protein PV328_007848 [Microctonus aethiopoides]|uniref:Reverse transcriptase n=1 Tax=Microctonus aethiopoides TaxID=144406 RepID=A0AA39F1J8_9HYME|nr:hypothetical protein PV328_007848 [Microctonus aethiopoides]